MKKSNLAVLLFILILSCVPLSGLETLLSLKGIPSQGGLVFGTVSDAVHQVQMDGEKLKLHENKFIFGFDRDEQLTHEIILFFEDHFEALKFEIAPVDYDIQKITRVQKKYVAPPSDSRLVNRIQLETNTLKVIREQINKNIFLYADSVFIRPVEKGWISSEFGGQRIINGIPQRPHNGLDIAVPRGTEIKAMTKGVVALTGDYFYNGKFVLLDHGNGLSSIYLHMSKIDVEKGDFVQTGDKIGEVGSSGRSTGNHLHWGVAWYKKRLNPSLLLKPQEEFLVFKSRTPDTLKIAKK